jgi:Recombinase
VGDLDRGVLGRPIREPSLFPSRSPRRPAAAARELSEVFASGRMRVRVGLYTGTATFAQFERRLIAERTKDVRHRFQGAALAVKKAQGVRLGRPASIPEELAKRIVSMRERGLTLQAICDALNAERIPTPRGGAFWRPTSLRAVLAT